MKTTLDLPEDLVREMKLRAVRQRRPLKELAAELLRKGLGMPPPTDSAPRTSSRVVLDEHGIPFILSDTDAPACQMTVEELLALEQQSQADEDLQRAGITV